MRLRNAAWFAGCLAAAGLAGCATTPPEQDPVQIRLNDLDARLSKIERVISNQSLLDLANQIEALRSDVRSMHNEVDELTHSVENGRKQQRDLYADLDRRLKALEARGGAAAPSGSVRNGGDGAAPEAGAAAQSAGGGGAPGLPVPGGTDTANYQAAFALLKDSQYENAIAGFQQFLAAFPESGLAENAQYWLGEAYYVNKNYLEAMAAFQRVVDKYPQSRKVPDALLKIGYCDYELKQWQAAHDVLSQVASSYPDTPAGNLAQQRLAKLAAEKH